MFCVLILVHAPCAFAQDSSQVTEGFHRTEGWTTRKVLATGIIGTVMCLSLYDSFNTWWKDAEKPFSFLEHNEENWLSGPHQGVDKPGHFFGAYALTKSLRNVLLWGGVDRSTAFWWAAGLGVWNGLQIEIGDGFTLYGFDYQDLTFDLAGVGYALLQAEVPALQDFNFKFSYWSNAGIKSPANFSNDYDAMCIWLAVNVHNLLPESVRDYWPEFLQLAVGYGVDDNQTRRKFAIGLDFNLEAFNPHNEDILLPQRIVNLLHLPAPAIRLVEDKHPRYDLLFTK